MAVYIVPPELLHWVKHTDIQLTRKILAPSHRPEMFDCVAVMASE